MPRFLASQTSKPLYMLDSLSPKIGLLRGMECASAGIWALHSGSALMHPVRLHGGEQWGTDSRSAQAHLISILHSQ